MKGYSRFRVSIILVLFFVIAISTMLKGKYHEGMDAHRKYLLTNEKQKKCSKSPEMIQFIELMCTGFDGDTKRIEDYFKLTEQCLRTHDSHIKQQEKQNERRRDGRRRRVHEGDAAAGGPRRRWHMPQAPPVSARAIPHVPPRRRSGNISAESSHQTPMRPNEEKRERDNGKGKNNGGFATRKNKHRFYREDSKNRSGNRRGLFLFCEQSPLLFGFFDPPSVIVLDYGYVEPGYGTVPPGLRHPVKVLLLVHPERNKSRIDVLPLGASRSIISYVCPAGPSAIRFRFGSLLRVAFLKNGINATRLYTVFKKAEGRWFRQTQGPTGPDRKTI